MPACLIAHVLTFFIFTCLVQKMSIDIDGGRCIQYIKIILCSTQMIFKTVDNGLLVHQGFFSFLFTPILTNYVNYNNGKKRRKEQRKSSYMCTRNYLS